MPDTLHWIEVVVSPTGATQIETPGFTGSACQQATRALEAALGLRQSETLTADYYQPHSEETRVATSADRAS